VFASSSHAEVGVPSSTIDVGLKPLCPGDQTLGVVALFGIERADASSQRLDFQRRQNLDPQCDGRMRALNSIQLASWPFDGDVDNRMTGDCHVRRNAFQLAHR